MQVPFVQRTAVRIEGDSTRDQFHTATSVIVNIPSFCGAGPRIHQNEHKKVCHAPRRSSQCHDIYAATKVVTRRKRSPGNDDA